MTFKHLITALLFLFSISAQAQLDTTGLIAHWTFDGHMNDVTGNGHDAAANSLTHPYPSITPNYKNGINTQNNSSIQITSDIKIQANYQPDLHLKKYTIAAIVKPDTFSSISNILALQSNPSPYWGVGENYALLLSSDFGTSKYYFKPKNIIGVHTNVAPMYQYKPSTEINRWYYVVTTYDGEYYKTYVDGLLKSIVRDTNSIYNPNIKNLLIGGMSSSLAYTYPFKGQIEDLRLYNRALPDSEIVRYPFEFFDTTVVLNPTISDSVVCSGDTTLYIPYIVSRIFRPGNKFIVQMSDTNFSFANAQDIGSDSVNGSGIIPCIISSSNSSGSYLIRLISTAPADTTAEFHINYHPAKNLSAKFNKNFYHRSTNIPYNSICQGDSVVFTVDSFNNMGLTPAEFVWQKNGYIINGATNNIYATRNISDKDSFRCIISSNHKCWNGSRDTTDYIAINVGKPTHPSITISINPSNTICIDDTAVLRVTSKTGAFKPSWKWIIERNYAPYGTYVNGHADSLVAYHIFKDGDSIYYLRESTSICVLGGTFISNKIGIHVDSNIVNPQLTIKATAGGNVPYGSDIVFSSNFSGAGPAPEYQWLLNSQPISGATGPTYIARHTIHNSVDAISLRAKNTTNICAKPKEITSSPITIQYGTGITNIGKERFSIYPNPNNGAFSIQFNEHIDGEMQLSITNTTGQTVYKKNHILNGDQLIIQLQANIPNGIYLLKLTTEENTISSRITIRR